MRFWSEVKELREINEAKEVEEVEEEDAAILTFERIT